MLMLKVHERAVPVQVVVPPLTNVPDHPAKNEVPSGVVTVIVPVWLLSRARVQVLVQLAKVPGGERDEKATVPPPVPPKVIAKFLFAARYGPTNGPPPPTGAAPAGMTKSVPVSRRAPARFSRPLPVCC